MCAGKIELTFLTKSQIYCHNFTLVMEQKDAFEELNRNLKRHVIHARRGQAPMRFPGRIQSISVQCSHASLCLLSVLVVLYAEHDRLVFLESFL